MDRLSELAPLYPCLWDPRDRNYLNETVKEAARTQLLAKCNESSDVPLDMPTLMHLIGVIFPQKTQTETNLTPGSRLVMEIDGAVIRKQSDTNTQQTSAPMSESTIVMENNSTKKEPTLKEIIAEFPCLWDRNDMNYTDKIVKARCRKIVLQKYNYYSSVQITESELLGKIDYLRRRKLAKKLPSSEPTLLVSKSGEVIEAKKHKQPTIKDILAKYPCLWDKTNKDYTDKTIRARCKKSALNEINRLSSVRVTPDDLERKLRVMKKKHKKISPPSESNQSTSTSTPLPVLESDQEKAIDNDGAEEKRTLEDIVIQFPCLWDKNDVNFKDYNMKERVRETVLEQYNRLSVPITMAELKRRLFAMQSRLKRQQKEPKFIQPKTEPEVEEGTDGDDAASETTPSESKVPSTASQPAAMSTEVTESNVDNNKKPTLEELVVEYPCLWDHNDLNFTDMTMKERSREKVVERFNSYSSVPITMEYLKKKLDCMRVRLNKQRRRKRKALNQTTACASETVSKSAGVNRRPHQAFEDMVAEFPCLWDPNDPYRNNQKMKDRCQEILLEKFNRQSSVQITIQELKRKLKALRVRQTRTKTMRSRNQPLTRALVETDAAKKYTLEELVAPYPCLWDPNDLNRFDITMKARCREQLLAKFNDLSSEPIDEEELKRKLTNLNARLREREAQARLAGESATDPARILTWNLPQDAATESNACQIINESQDTTNQMVFGTVISFDWCRICGEVKKHCVDATSDEKPYISSNKTTIAINDINIELDFADNKLPTNICEDCDKKLEDMYKFIELVKSTQDNFNNLINAETQKGALETGDNENSERKTVKVTIDLNIAASKLDDNNTQEVLGTGQCTDENEVKMKMMRNSEQDNDSDEDNLVIKVENPYDDEYDHKMAEQSADDDFTSLGDVDENDMEIKSNIEVGPVTISNGSGNVSAEINKCRVSVDISQNVLDSNNDGRHIESVSVVSNDNTFRDGEDRNLDRAITLDNGIKVVFGDNINNAQSSIKDICEESVDIKEEVIDIDADNNEEQEVIHYVLNEDDGITVKEENIGMNDSNLSE